MAVIDAQARLIAETWAYDDEPPGPGLRSVVSVEVLRLAEPAAPGRPLGVFLTSDAAIADILGHLQELTLVVVEFPKFRDGRGFSLARALRERHGFTGDIRALGHVLPDQFAALVGCGFSSIVTPPDHPPEQWLAVAPRARPPGMGGGPLLQRMVMRAAAGPAQLRCGHD